MDFIASILLEFVKIGLVLVVYYETNIAPILMSGGVKFLSILCVLISFGFFAVTDKNPRNQFLMIVFGTIGFGLGAHSLILTITK